MTVVDMRPVGRERVITFGNKVCRSGALGAVSVCRYAMPRDGSGLVRSSAPFYGRSV